MKKWTSKQKYVTFRECREMNLFAQKDFSIRFSDSLNSINGFVDYVVFCQDTLAKQKSDRLNITSSFKISKYAIETTAICIPNIELRFKVNQDEYVKCDESTILNQWPRIQATIDQPEQLKNVLLIGEDEYLVNDLYDLVDRYLNKRKVCYILSV